MKVFIITNVNGKVIGHARVEERPASDAPLELRPLPLPGQQVYEIEVSRELLETESVEELHQRLGKHLEEWQRSKNSSTE